jgi:predicted regulator of Ras-like GTPase activity (Roadblock/LC7/MglB family)
MFPSMDADEALHHLLEVSDEVRAAVVIERGAATASSLPEEEASEFVAGLGEAMLAYAGTLRRGVPVKQLEADTPHGDVYIVRQGDRAVVAVAAPGSLAGLVQHDLRTLLGSLSRRRRSAVAHA